LTLRFADLALVEESLPIAPSHRTQACKRRLLRFGVASAQSRLPLLRPADCPQEASHRSVLGSSWQEHGSRTRLERLGQGVRQQTTKSQDSLARILFPNASADLPRPTLSRIIF